MINQENKQDLRVIRTARTVEAINEAARAGFFPLVKKLTRLKKIRSKYAVFQNPETGEVSVTGDFRSMRGQKPIIDFTFYYPYQFANPFAAYLIPADLKVGETVMLEDLIEDLEGESWNQGDVYRLQSSEAKWNGEDFVINHIVSPYDSFVG